MSALTRENQVAVFNKLMNQPIGDNPKETSRKNLSLGIGLIFSELKELAEASGMVGTFKVLSTEAMGIKLSDEEKAKLLSEDTGIVNEVLQLDGLVDVQYTTSWAVNVFGHSNYFSEAFTEGCRSNNSKACKTLEEADETKAYWENPENNEGGGEHFIETVTVNPPDDVLASSETYYVVKRKGDGKVRKAKNYSKANFRQFFIKDDFLHGK